MSPDREGAAVEALAELLATVCNREWRWITEATREKWREKARAVIAAGWVPESEVVEREAAALEAAADEFWRFFLRLPHTPSPLGDFVQRKVIEFRDRASRIRGGRS